jgi:D-alanyl-D-alanine carboxypeptidase
MTPGDLALWDISLITGSILKPESLRALTTEVNLKNGAHTGYALGLGVSNNNGRRVWSHGGGTSGFTSANVTYPDDRVAITVLTNSEGNASSLIERQIARLVMAPAEDPTAASALESVRRIFGGLQEGQLDRSLLDSSANAYFTAAAIEDYTSSLKPFGTPSSFTQIEKSDRGGMTARSFSIRAGERSLRLSTFFTPDGHIAQFLVYPAQ